MPGNFQEWFYTHVMTLADIRERITKSAATGGWDHDMAVMQGAIGNANTAKTHFSTVNTGKPQHDPTAYPNMMVGMLINVTSMARRQEEFSSEKSFLICLQNMWNTPRLLLRMAREECSIIVLPTEKKNFIPLDQQNFTDEHVCLLVTEEEGTRRKCWNRTTVSQSP